MAIDTTLVRSRRSLLTAALASVAGAAAATVAGAQRVLAAGDDGTPIAVGGLYDDARTETTIVNNTNSQPALRVGSNQAGDGLQAFSNSGFGVSASVYTGEGVYGESTKGTGIHGVAGTVSGIAQNYPAAVLGEAKLPAGVSILGNNYATSGVAIGVQGTSHSFAGLGTIGWATHGGTGVIGVAGSVFPSVPAATGVYGKAAGGRGGAFSGGAAQVRLVPSSKATHPTSGQAGDLFVDASHRLWFCKGGSTWKRLS